MAGSGGSRTPVGDRRLEAGSFGASHPAALILQVPPGGVQHVDEQGEHVAVLACLHRAISDVELIDQFELPANDLFAERVIAGAEQPDAVSSRRPGSRVEHRAGIG